MFLQKANEVKSGEIAEIDECESSPCVNGDCNDHVAYYDCTCDAGYTDYDCNVGTPPIFIKISQNFGDNVRIWWI